jgi:putative Holliday junction resolvase
VRIIAVDPGERHIGLAVSDETGMVARPLATLTHQARERDAEQIATAAAEQGAGLIIVGHPLNSEGEPGPQARHAERLAEAVRAHTAIPVALHDESFSSQTAAEAMRAAGKRRQARRADIHAAAAAAILQSYIDQGQPDGHTGEAPEG